MIANQTPNCKKVAMSQQVGFRFQGDVFAGGSLVLSTTARLLKALSDGNVDVLAVTAACT